MTAEAIRNIPEKHSGAHESGLIRDANLLSKSYMKDLRGVILNQFDNKRDESPADIYKNTASVLGYLRDVYRSIEQDNNFDNPGVIDSLVGNKTEMTFMALFSRMAQNGGNRLKVAPASSLQDASAPDSDTLTGFDFMIYVRNRGIVKYQTKTSRESSRLKAPLYADDIIVQSIEDVVGTKDNIARLEDAIVRDANEEPTEDDAFIIETATNNILLGIDRYTGEADERHRALGGKALGRSDVGLAS